jgi:hypothetical protein
VLIGVGWIGGPEKEKEKEKEKKRPRRHSRTPPIIGVVIVTITTCNPPCEKRLAVAG